MPPDTPDRHRRRPGEEIGQVLLDPVSRPPRRLLRSSLIGKDGDREHALARLDKVVLSEAWDLPEDGNETAPDRRNQLLHRAARGELVLADGEIALTRGWRADHRAGLLGLDGDGATSEE